MSTLSVGNFVSFQDPANEGTLFFFQNFFINKAMAYDDHQYEFAPFGFSGVTINRNGDGTDASLVFPNNALTRGWALRAIEDRWLVRVDVVLVDISSTTSVDIAGRVHQYFGQVSSGRWDEASLSLSVGTVLDAVGADVPRRNLSQDLVGSLPITSNVSLQ
jgi:hypothetical protein